jgi:hypothetical protein
MLEKIPKGVDKYYNKALFSTENIHTNFYVFRQNYQNDIFIKKSSLNPVNSAGVSFGKLSDKVNTTSSNCAYCNGDFYTEEQIKKIAQEICTAQGKNLAKLATEYKNKIEQPNIENALMSAKRKYNKKQIKFFNALIKKANMYPEMTAEEILDKKLLSRINKKINSAEKIITFNLLPLLKTTDHKISKLNGGTESPDNLTTVCQGCNQLKSGDDLDEFILKYSITAVNILDSTALKNNSSNSK